jgi:hypothetical protein
MRHKRHHARSGNVDVYQRRRRTVFVNPDSLRETKIVLMDHEPFKLQVLVFDLDRMGPFFIDFKKFNNERILICLNENIFTYFPSLPKCNL